jgi:penicillin amidase
MIRRRQAVVAAVMLLIVVGARRGAVQDDRFKTLARESVSAIEGDFAVAGLRAPVEVIRDRWGVPHIYAQNTDDLFFAQGYVVAQDRLWQMELWRRQREGRMAEILGPSAVARDRQARMLKYRGPMDDREWTSYHQDGKRIFTAFAAGVNAYIAASAANLPVEFKLTGIKPDPWTAETVVLRSATFGNATSELTLARDVARLGLEAANRQRQVQPADTLKVPDGLDVSLIDDTVTTGGGGRGGAARGRRGVEGRGGAEGRGAPGGRGLSPGNNVPELIEPYRSWLGRGGTSYVGRGFSPGDPDAGAIAEPGSNNWVVSGALSATGKPVVVNDPHRDVTNPSLRYIVHLVAPGWNVIGAVEAPFVGVAIGHNERLGWGLTIVGTDMEDVYVEELNAADPNQLKWKGGWEPLRLVKEEIKIKGGTSETVELKYSRHGPIFHEDRARHRAYALRSALLEPGGAAYLGGLRLSQATDCRQFLDAAVAWKAPSENLICGDVDGTISWQATAATPNCVGWNGRLPVPGTGAYEWDGFRRDLPREINPPRGFVATANNNIHPPGFARPVMYQTAGSGEFDRITRLLQLIKPGQKYTLDDHKRMQIDSLHLRAQTELPLFRGWTSATPEVERGRQMLAGWDGRLEKGSAAAALHAVWRAGASAEERDPATPIDRRKPLHEASLTRAIQQMTETQGPDWSQWRWGRRHTRAFPHALVPVFSLPTVERPGGAGTVAADGASYREILDAADWDRSIVTNVPGQSGQPESPYYGNLLKLWADDEYFPLVYSRARVAREAGNRMALRPR